MTTIRMGASAMSVDIKDPDGNPHTIDLSQFVSYFVPKGKSVFVRKTDHKSVRLVSDAVCAAHGIAAAPFVAPPPKPKRVRQFTPALLPNELGM